MLDDMDRGPKIVLVIIVAVLLLVLAVPLVIILAAVLATFVLGLGEEAALLVPVCGPVLGRRIRRSAVERFGVAVRRFAELCPPRSESHLSARRERSP